MIINSCSQSDAGAKTRSTLMSVVNTLRKHGLDVADHLKGVLDELAKDIKQNPIPLLFKSYPPED